VALKTAGELETRARNIALKLYWPVCAILLAISVASFSVQPHLRDSFSANPGLWIFPVFGVAGLMGVRFCLSTRWNLGSFLCSGAMIVGLLCSAAFGLYPYVLPSSGDLSLGLTVHSVAAPAYGLRIGLFWWIPAFLLALGYSTFVYRHFRGKISPEARLMVDVNAETYSDSGRSALSPGTVALGAGERRI
jgi:cytochrome d ubiquinol oxidase subunit II